MWRLIYATRKLKAGEIRRLRQSLDDLSFSCGADLQEASLPPELDGIVFVKRMYCHEPIERLYYSANFEQQYQKLLAMKHPRTSSLLNWVHLHRKVYHLKVLLRLSI